MKFINICKFCSTDKRREEAQQWRVAAVWAGHTGVPKLALACRSACRLCAFNHTSCSELKIGIIFFLLSLEENKTPHMSRIQDCITWNPDILGLQSEVLRIEGPDLMEMWWNWHSVIPLSWISRYLDHLKISFQFYRNQATSIPKATFISLFWPNLRFILFFTDMWEPSKKDHQYRHLNEKNLVCFFAPKWKWPSFLCPEFMKTNKRK